MVIVDLHAPVAVVPPHQASTFWSTSLNDLELLLDLDAQGVHVSIIGNAGYNDPALGQIAANIANMFGPPSASELAGYSTARVNNQKAKTAEQLAQMAVDKAGFDQQVFDRLGVAAGNYNPTQSYYAQDQNNATAIRGQDVVAATDLAMNADDNRTDFLIERFGTADPYHTAPVVPGDIAASFNLPELPARVGLPKPLSETEWKATQGQRLVDSGAISDTDLVDLIASDGEGSAREQQIDRLAAQLISTGRYTDPAFARDMAVGIIDGRYEQSKDPVTGEVVVIDMTTNMPADMQAPNLAPDSGLTGDPVIDAVMAPGAGAAPVVPATGAPAESEFGEAYPNSRDSFGVGGALTGLINTGTDAFGAKVPFPEVQNTQASFKVLRERLLSDMEAAYGGRQPPSWLMQEIRNLTPDAGNAFEGSGAATAKLNAMGRQMEQQLQLTQRQLEGSIGQTRRQELEAEAASLHSSITSITSALNSFPGQQASGPRVENAPAAGSVPQGVDPADWEYMTEEERRLFQ